MAKPKVQDDRVEDFNNAIVLKFSLGDEVIGRWHDGLGYHAEVVKFDMLNLRVHLLYDDNARGWAELKDVRMADASDWSVPSCSQCLLRRAEMRHLPRSELEAIEASKVNEPTYRCHDCGWVFHESCHMPSLTPDVIALQGGISKFMCRACTFMHVGKIIDEVKAKNKLDTLCKDAKRDPSFQAHELKFAMFEKWKRHLPYSLEELTWKDRAGNEQNAYCYCGGPGRWQSQMFQCGKCGQWFHEKCVRASVVLGCSAAGKEPIKVPDLINYDTFYAYTCARCSSDGFDSIERFPTTWLDVIIICMLNISDGKAKLFIKKKILPWLKENAKTFVFGKQEAAFPTSDAQWIELVTNIVKSSANRFTASFSNQPARSSSPVPTAQSTTDPWVILKQRSYNPRKLPELKSLNMRRSRKSAVSDHEDDDDGTSNKKGRPKKYPLSEKEAEAEKILQKMAGVAHLMSTGHRPNIPPLDSQSSPFYKLMPQLYSHQTKPLTVHIPEYIYNGEYVLVQPLRYDYSAGEASEGSPTTSISASPSQLVGAKKRKAYRPLHSYSAGSTNSRPRASNGSGSDGAPSVSSISPIAMFS